MIIKKFNRYNIAIFEKNISYTLWHSTSSYILNHWAELRCWFVVTAAYSSVHFQLLEQTIYNFLWPRSSSLLYPQSSQTERVLSSTYLACTIGVWCMYLLLLPLQSQVESITYMGLYLCVSSLVHQQTVFQCKLESIACMSCHAKRRLQRRHYRILLAASCEACH